MTAKTQWERIKATDAKQQEIAALGRKITDLVHVIYAAHKEQYALDTITPYEEQLKELSRKQAQLAAELEAEYLDIQKSYPVR